MKKINLYDYQQEMLENITKALTGRSQVTFYDQNGKKMKVGNSVMVQMPTGTGKTYVMAAVVKWFLEKYEKGEVWLIAHRKELVEQMQQTMDRFCLEYAEKEEELKEKVRIRVLSIQWLSRHIGEMEAKGRKPGFIVVDEAHHALADSYQDVFDRNRPALKMGMTATPCRMNKGILWWLVHSFAHLPKYCRFHPAWLSGSLQLCGDWQVFARPADCGSLEGAWQ